MPTTYNDLINRFRDNPREIPTAPSTKAAPKWFCVCERDGAVWVASGREHPNACSVCPDRRLNPAEFSAMLALYLRRRRGESVWQEASRRSLNASYWFGIFNDMRDELYQAISDHEQGGA